MDILQKVKKPNLIVDDKHKWSIIKIYYTENPHVPYPTAQLYTGYVNCTKYDYLYFQVRRTWYRLDAKYASCRTLLNLDKVLYLEGTIESLISETQSIERRIERKQKELYDLLYKTTSCKLKQNV